MTKVVILLASLVVSVPSLAQESRHSTYPFEPKEYRPPSFEFAVGPDTSSFHMNGDSVSEGTVWIEIERPTMLVPVSDSAGAVKGDFSTLNVPPETRHQKKSTQAQSSYSPPSHLAPFSRPVAVFFDFDSDVPLNPEVLESVQPGSSVMLIGRADAIGTDAYNNTLSRRRAGAVRALLLMKGLSSEQIKIKALGSKDPIASNDTAEGRALNRQVSIDAQQERK